MSMVWGNVLDAPAEPWLDSLESGSQVFLVKEKLFAIVVSPWLPSESGHGRGSLRILPYEPCRCGDKPRQRSEMWISDTHGQGCDKSQILLPVEVSSIPEREATDVTIRKLEGQLASVLTRLHAIEECITSLCENLNSDYSIEEALTQLISNWNNR